jgi:uncharacterized protein YbjT (DUF2867 family)
MILVAGASSKPGQKLIPMLVDKGYQVRALTRNPQQLDFAHFPGVEVIEGDIRQPDTLLRACEGAEAVVSSVTAVVNVGDNNVHTVDDAGNRLLVETAKKSGVKRFVLCPRMARQRSCSGFLSHQAWCRGVHQIYQYPVYDPAPYGVHGNLVRTYW